LSARRLGIILHRECPHDFQLSLLNLHAHNVGDHGDAVDLFANIVDFEFHRSGSRRRHAMVGDVLMDGAD